MTNAMKVAVLPGHKIRRAAADRVERAVRQVLADSLRTGDIREEGTTMAGTHAMGDAVVAAVH